MIAARSMRNLLPAAAVVLMNTLLSATALGGLNGWSRTWTKQSEDGQFVLVMLAPVSTEEELDVLSKSKSAHAEETLREVAAIRARYSQSGLYRNDGFRQPLWTMKFQSDYFDAFVAPDGRHVVFFSTEWRDTHYQVITFYDRGSPLASYGIEELWSAMPSMRWKHAIRNSRSPDADFRFNDKAVSCTMQTEAGETFVFDVTTGKIIGQSSPWPLYFASAIGFPLLTIAGVILAIAWFRARSRRQRTNSPVEPHGVTSRAKHR